MAKQNLLLVDADSRSLRVLEVSLRKSGYSVAACSDAAGALEMMELSQPDLIISDTRLPGTDGFQFVEEIRKRPEWSGIPFMFLSSDVSLESKVKGLELHVEDYLTKPIYTKEIITRVNLVLQRKQREGIGRRDATARTRFSGSLGDMGLVDLFQTIDISRKTGVLFLTSPNQRGAVYFREGSLVDAELGKLRGEQAIYRALVWSEGQFEIDFRPVRRDDVINTPTQAVLMEGMRRMDEWGRILEQLPPLDSVFEVNEDELIERLAEIPDEINEILRHFDGRNSLIGVVDSCSGNDLETLTAISKLYFEGIIRDTGRRTSVLPSNPDEPQELSSVPSQPSPDISDSDSDAALAEVVPKAPTIKPASGVESANQATLSAFGSSSRPASANAFSAEVARPSNPVMVGAPPTPIPQGTVDSALVGTSPSGRKTNLDFNGSGTDREGALPARISGIDKAQARSESEPAQNREKSLPKTPVGDQTIATESNSVAKKGALFGVGLGDRSERKELSHSDRETVAPPRKRSRRRKKRPILSTGASVVTSLPKSPDPREHARASSTAAAQLWQNPDAPTGSSSDGAPKAIKAAPTSPQVEPLHDVALLDKSAERLAGSNLTWHPRTKHGGAAPDNTPAFVEDNSVAELLPKSPGFRIAKRTAISLVVCGLVSLAGYQIYTQFFSTKQKHEDKAKKGAVELPPPPAQQTPTVRVTTDIERPAPATTPPPSAEIVTPPEPPVEDLERGDQPTPAIPGKTGVAPMQPERAAQAQQEKSANAPTAPAEIIARARRLEHSRRRNEAVALYQQVLELDPNHSEALAKLAFNFLNQGKNREAVDYASRALSGDPSSSEAWIVLGAAKEALNDQEGARDAYRRCAEVGKGVYLAECRRMVR